jgi:flagellar protein FlbD
MIVLEAMGGDTFAVNTELIERIDSNTNTLIKMATGEQWMVSQSLDEVLALIEQDRAKNLSNALALLTSLTAENRKSGARRHDEEEV